MAKVYEGDEEVNDFEMAMAACTWNEHTDVSTLLADWWALKRILHVARGYVSSHGSGDLALMIEKYDNNELFEDVWVSRTQDNPFYKLPWTAPLPEQIPQQWGKQD